MTQVNSFQIRLKLLDDIQRPKLSYEPDISLLIDSKVTFQIESCFTFDGIVTQFPGLFLQQNSESNLLLILL